jgi:hypothetical protein
MVERQAASDAGGGIRTLKPVRAVVFETTAYTIPPRRLVYPGDNITI